MTLSQSLPSNTFIFWIVVEAQQTMTLSLVYPVFNIVLVLVVLKLLKKWIIRTVTVKKKKVLLAKKISYNISSFNCKKNMIRFQKSPSIEP